MTVLNKKSNPPLIEKLGSAGIDLLDDIYAHHPPLRNVSIGEIDIDTSCPLNGHEKFFTIPLDVARKSHLFDGSLLREVRVPGSYLSRFIKFDTRFKYDNRESDEDRGLIGKLFTMLHILDPAEGPVLYGAASSYIFDTKALLAAWEADGFPLRWGFTD
jgi:hypothetical protein